jgi:hypothetical protein
MTSTSETCEAGEPQPGDLVWGAANIGRVIHRSEKWVHNHWRKLPINKVPGGGLCGSASRLIEYCAGGSKRGVR